MANGKELNRIVTTFPNPEEINNSFETASSKGLSKITAGYGKVVFGAMLVEEIGLKTIMAKCVRFGAWLESLVVLAEEE